MTCEACYKLLVLYDEKCICILTSTILYTGKSESHACRSQLRLYYTPVHCFPILVSSILYTRCIQIEELSVGNLSFHHIIQRSMHLPLSLVYNIYWPCSNRGAKRGGSQLPPRSQHSLYYIAVNAFASQPRLYYILAVLKSRS